MKNIKKIIALMLVVMSCMSGVGVSVDAQEYRTNKFEKFLCLHACFCEGELFTKPISDRVCEIHCITHGKTFVIDFDEYIENGWCTHEGNMTVDGRQCLDCKQVFTYSDFDIDVLTEEETTEYNNEESCKHMDAIEDVTIKRRNVDQNEYHLVVEIRETTCKKCGNISEDEVIIGQESHISQKDQNICTLCNGNINCSHSEKSKTTLKLFARFVDEDYHEYTYETVLKCNRCSMNVNVLSSWTERERHGLENYYCADCNYTEPHCEHNTEEKVIGRQVISSRGDQHYSLLTWVQQCTLCGERIGNQYAGNVVEDHVYNSNGICECGQAQSKKIGYVSEKVETDRLNVRWSPEISPNNIAGKLYLGDEVVIVGEKGEFYRIEFANDEAFVHKNYITFTKPIVSVNISSSYLQKVNAFLSDSRWENGTSWNGNQTAKLSSYSSWGCCAYCSDFVKYVFNKPSPRSGSYFTNINEIRSGDILYVTPMHWIIVLERNGNALKTAEANWGNRVVVGNNYSISNGKLYRNGKIASTFQYGYHFQNVATSASGTIAATLQINNATPSVSTQALQNTKVNFVNGNLSAWKSLLDSKKQSCDLILSTLNDINLRSAIQRSLGVTAASAAFKNPAKLVKILDPEQILGLASIAVSEKFYIAGNSNYNNFSRYSSVKTEAEAELVFNIFKDSLANYDAVIAMNYDTISKFSSGKYYTLKMLGTFLESIADTALGDYKIAELGSKVITGAEFIDDVCDSSVGLLEFTKTKVQWNNIWNKL